MRPSYTLHAHTHRQFYLMQTHYPSVCLNLTYLLYHCPMLHLIQVTSIDLCSAGDVIY